MTDEEMLRRAADFAAELCQRRTLREFAARPVPRQLIEHCLRAAGSAPSGANRQPWRFVVVTDAELRRRLRAEAEKRERAFYEHRAPQSWRDALQPLGTGAEKPFLELAPVLIVVFALRHGIGEQGQRLPNYYVSESVGIAVGLLVTAMHHVGLACLTYTPSRMGFLRPLLGRPENERPYLIVAAGHPAEGARPPQLARKPLEEISLFL